MESEERGRRVVPWPPKTARAGPRCAGGAACGLASRAKPHAAPPTGTGLNQQRAELVDERVGDRGAARAGPQVSRARRSGGVLAPVPGLRPVRPAAERGRFVRVLGGEAVAELQGVVGEFEPVVSPRWG